MRIISNHILLFVLIFCSLVAKSQDESGKVCRVENGRIIFQLNLKWTDKEKKEMSERFDLDSVLIASAYKGETTFSFKGDTWKVVKVKPNLIELSKPFSANIDKGLNKYDDLFLLVDKWINFVGTAPVNSEIFGVNSFKIAYTFSYGKRAWFYLPGYKTSQNVYISGSFNNWSTTGNPMKAADSGWTVDLNLQPGRYTYKFIADGKWINDPSNNLRENDGAGGYNSIVYCPNHTFKLKGFAEAKKVVVTGNFFNWNQRGLAMQKTDDGWALPIWFRDGTYAYKFIADNKWMTDAANPVEHKDKEGNDNSFISIGNPYLFKLDGHTDAGKVFLAGSFNGWNDAELLMDKTGKGWELSYVLPAGNYEYKFIEDGTWMTDPGNPFSNGSGNSVNSFIALKANHLFELANYDDAKSVIVTGSFTNWSTKGYRMVKQGGKWIFPLFLQQGKHLYKFIVDGKWIIDPANDLYEANEVGTDNSVLWIKP
jgi:hypothetical protein